MHRSWTLVLFLTLLLIAAHTPDELHPTPWSVDFVGEGASTLDGNPLPVGAVVRAYDPTGVLAGQTEVTLAGWYLVSVYGDDPQTPELDEGAGSGDTIAFTVDGYQAVPLGPDPPVWSTSGSRLHVELRALRQAHTSLHVGRRLRSRLPSDGGRPFDRVCPEFLEGLRAGSDAPGAELRRLTGSGWLLPALRPRQRRGCRCWRSAGGGRPVAHSLS